MLRLVENYSLKDYNSFGINIKTKYFLEFAYPDEILSFFHADKAWKNRNLLFLGGGSNLLFMNDFDGLVISPDIQGINLTREDKDYVWVEAGAGVVWDKFVEFCVARGWGGAENLSLIPGKVGAAPVQNIGAYGQEASETIDSVIGIDFKRQEKQEIKAGACNFRYRSSIFKNEQRDNFLITSVVFRLNKNPVLNLGYGNLEDEVKKNGIPDLRMVRDAVIRTRRSKLPDPAILGNAGSFFRNPVVSDEMYHKLKKIRNETPAYPEKNGGVKLSAGWLIEQSGWKGFRQGDAGVHDKQALVLVNYGQATGLEIYKLSESIRKSVLDKFDVMLEREVLII